MLSAAEDGEVAGGVGSPTTAKKPKRKGSRREKERTAVVPAAVGTEASTPAGALLHLPASHTDARDEKLEEAKAKKEKKSAAAHKRQKSKGGGGGGTLCTTPTSSAVLPIQSSTSSAPAAALHVCRREKLVEELLSSERAHVHNLNAFLHDYVIPIRDKKILSTDELQGILCNLELIRRWNVEFLNQLESALEDERGFGELFLEMVLPLMFSPGLCARPSASDHLLVGGGRCGRISCRCCDSCTHSTTRTTPTPWTTTRNARRTRSLLPSSRCIRALKSRVCCTLCSPSRPTLTTHAWLHLTTERERQACREAARGGGVQRCPLSFQELPQLPLFAHTAHLGLLLPTQGSSGSSKVSLDSCRC